MKYVVIRVILSDFDSVLQGVPFDTDDAMFYPATPRHSIGPNSLPPPLLEQTLHPQPLQPQPLHPQSLTPGQPPGHRSSSQPQQLQQTPYPQSVPQRPPPTVTFVFRNRLSISQLIRLHRRPLLEESSLTLHAIVSFRRRRTSDVCSRSAKSGEGMRAFSPRRSLTRSPRTSRARISSRCAAMPVTHHDQLTIGYHSGVLRSLSRLSRAHLRSNPVGVRAGRTLA